MINLRSVGDVRYATKPLSYLLLKGQKQSDALKKVLSFFKKPVSVKQTIVGGADAVEVEPDNQVPTSS